MADHEDEECTCISENAVVLRELRIVEVIEDDGIIYKVDLSHDGADGPLPLAGVLELAEWARAIATAPLIADMVHNMLHGEEVDEDE